MVQSAPSPPESVLQIRDEQGGWTASIGGEARLAGESFHHLRFEPDPAWDTYLLQRYLLHGDLTIGESARLFAELQYSSVTGRETDPRPTDQDAPDVHQAFGEAHGESWFARAGRQELQYGSSRLISVRNGPNVRLAFDAARLRAEFGGWTLDAFAGRPVEIDRGAFDDQAEEDELLAGFYATLASSDTLPGGLDLYLLAYINDEAEFAQGAGRERRGSIGSRWFGTSGGLDWNFEGVAQWGSFEDDPIRAWTLASDSGFTWSDATWKPRLGLKADFISGDADRDHDRLGTFNALFPRGSYFGDIGIVGPANLIDLHPSLDLHFTADVTLTADCVFFWRASTDDALYGPSGNIVRDDPTSEARYIGTQPSLIASWRVDRRLTLIATATHFAPGAFLRETGPHESIDFFRLEAIFRF